MTAALREDPPVRVGVALGAGSAASMAHIGALEVLAEAGIRIQCAAGTSAGAVVGAALAAGRLPELRESMEGLSRRGVLRLFDLAWPREGLLHGRRALEFIGTTLGETIESLSIPFAAVATDLRSGDEVILNQGPVFDAVRASMAVPGIFTPWRVGGRLLIDGGLVNPVPVSVARALGAEFVIALNVLPLLKKRRKPDRIVSPALRTVQSTGSESQEPDATIDEKIGLVDIVWHASRILATQVASSRLRDDRPDCLIQIPVPELGMFDVHRTAELVELGRDTAEKALPELRRALARAVPLHRRVQNWMNRAATIFDAS